MKSIDIESVNIEASRRMTDHFHASQVGEGNKHLLKHLHGRLKRFGRATLFDGDTGEEIAVFTRATPASALVAFVDGLHFEKTFFESAAN